VRQN